VNGFSFWLICISAFLFGYVFCDLIEELGISKKKAHSWTNIFGLAFLSFIAYLLFPFFTQGVFVLNDIAAFSTTSDGIFLWFSVMLFIGGAIHLIEHVVKEQKTSAVSVANISNKQKQT